MIPPVNLTLWFLPLAVLLGTIAGYLVRPVVERVRGWWKWREAEKVIAELVEAERAQYTADNSVVIYTCDGDPLAYDVGRRLRARYYPEAE